MAVDPDRQRFLGKLLPVRMPTTARRLASGPGWYVLDVIRTAGLHDRGEEEQPERPSISAVTAGTIQ